MSIRVRGPRSAVFDLVSLDPEPGVRLLRVEGALSTADHPKLRGILYAASEDKGSPTKAVVVDLRGCDFLAAVCLREMMEASDELLRRGGWGLRLVTEEASALERRMWPVAGHQRLATHRTPSSAVFSLRGMPERQGAGSP